MIEEIETLYPSIELTDEEESNICFLSFPDSHSNTTGDTVFSFRFPRVTSAGGVLSDSIECVHLNGFVFNRVQRDKNIKRGYLQKSIVIITERSDLLLYTLFKNVIRIVGPVYFSFLSKELGEGIASLFCYFFVSHVGLSFEEFLHTLYGEISSWPPLQAAINHELPVLGKTMNFFVCMDELRGCGYEAAISNVFYLTDSEKDLGVVPLIDDLHVYKTLYQILPDLGKLWEIVLLGEPLLVFGQTPEQTANVVACLMSLILPLRYGGEWRPYFTIHDSDYKKFSSSALKLQGRSIVLGVTNPFFLRELKDWPNKLILGPDDDDMVFGGSEVKRGTSEKSVLSLSAPGGEKHVPIAKRSNLNTSKPNVVVQTSLDSKYKCLLPQKDGKELLDELVPLKGAKGNAGEANWRDINGALARSNNRIIRKKFYERTQQLLIPLESYFTSLMPVIPSAQTASPQRGFRDAERRIRAFDKADFLKRVTETQTIPFFEGGKKRVEFYKRFVNTRTFDLWYFEKMKRTYNHLEEVQKNYLSRKLSNSENDYTLRNSSNSSNNNNNNNNSSNNSNNVDEDGDEWLD